MNNTMNNTMKTVYAIGATPKNPWLNEVRGKTQILYIAKEDVEQHKLFDGNNGVEVAEHIASWWLTKNDYSGYHEVKFIKMVAPNEFIK